jgi:hypothetical protein
MADVETEVMTTSAIVAEVEEIVTMEMKRGRKVGERRAEAKADAIIVRLWRID